MFNPFKKKDKLKPTFIELLDRSGYFEFTKSEELDKLKMSIQSNYTKFRTFTTTYDSNRNPTCKKAYLCDSKMLFERNGFHYQLKNMREGIENVCQYDDLINHIPVSYDYESNPNGNWFEAVIDYYKKIEQLFKATIF